jgi:hypothetical protein
VSLGWAGHVAVKGDKKNVRRPGGTSLRAATRKTEMDMRRRH